MKSDAAKEMFRRRGREFHFAAQFLPSGKRDAVAALFAFCDLVVDATKEDSRGEKTAMVRGRIEDVFSGELELPKPEFRDPTQHALASFAAAVRKFQIPRQTMIDFLDARVMDQTVTRYATWNSLRKYCELSAGSVAIAVSCILGLTSADGRKHLVDLAVALRLIQILRSLNHDLEADRVYLPMEDLARCRVSQRALLDKTENENFAKLIRFEVDRAKELLDKSLAGLPFLGSDRARMSAAALVELHRMILDSMARRGYHVMRRTISLTMPQKLRVLPAAWRTARSKAAAKAR